VGQVVAKNLQPKRSCLIFSGVGGGHQTHQRSPSKLFKNQDNFRDATTFVNRHLVIHFLLPARYQQLTVLLLVVVALNDAAATRF
jgi:hypothetical protein